MYFFQLPGYHHQIITSVNFFFAYKLVLNVFFSCNVFIILMKILIVDHEFVYSVESSLIQYIDSL